MTIEDRVKAITREWYVNTDGRFFSGNMRADFVETQIRDALLSMIEECAALIEPFDDVAPDATDYNRGLNHSRREAAKMIRALQSNNKEGT